MGFTTLASIDMLDNILFNPNFAALLISYDDDSAKDLFQNKIHFAWSHFHPDLKSKYIVDSSRTNMLRLDLGENNFSYIKVDNTGRSGTYNQLHVSELGKISKRFPEKVDEIIRGTFPCVHPPNGQITIESTSEGPFGAFYDMCMNAYAKPKDHVYRSSEFKFFFYNWQWDSISLANVLQPLSKSSFPKEFLDIQAKHNELAKDDPLLTPVTDQMLTWYYNTWEDDCQRSFKKLFLEYPLTVEDAFRKDSNSVFDTSKIQKLLAQTSSLPSPSNFRNWLFFDTIQPNHEYVLGADPSEGVSRDHSAAVLLDITKPKVVATYKDNTIPPDLFAYELKSTAELANMAFIIPERNNSGHATITKLKDIYPIEKIYHEEKTLQEEDYTTLTLGFRTTGASKPKMFYDLNTAINEDDIEIPSEEILKECLALDRKFLSEIRIKDDEISNHFDLLTALALAWQGRLQAMEENSTTIVISSPTNSDPFSLI